MNIKILAAVAAAALVSVTAFPRVLAAESDIVLGDIDDLSGLYADIQGTGGLEAMKMAIADSGGTVLGRNVQILMADHEVAAS